MSKFKRGVTTGQKGMILLACEFLEEYRSALDAILAVPNTDVTTQEKETVRFINEARTLKVVRIRNAILELNQIVEEQK
jgi:hypothetical protein